MNNSTKAIINFAYFLSNFPHTWFEDCFKDDPVYNHLKETYLSIANDAMDNDGFMGPKYMLRFFMQLSRDRQAKMAKWVTDNYKAFKNLKQEDETTS